MKSDEDGGDAQPQQASRLHLSRYDSSSDEFVIGKSNISEIKANIEEFLKRNEYFILSMTLKI